MNDNGIIFKVQAVWTPKPYGFDKIYKCIYAILTCPASATFLMETIGLVATTSLEEPLKYLKHTCVISFSKTCTMSPKSQVICPVGPPLAPRILLSRNLELSLSSVEIKQSENQMYSKQDKTAIAKTTLETQPLILKL